MGYLRWVCCGTLKQLATKAKESTVWLWSLGMKDMLNARIKFSIRSYTSSYKTLITIVVSDKYFSLVVLLILNHQK